MPQFQTFFTPERLSDFWYLLKWLLFLAAPIIMISLAIYVIGFLVQVVVKSVRKSTVDDDEDDDYDVYRY